MPVGRQHSPVRWTPKGTGELGWLLCLSFSNTRALRIINSVLCHGLKTLSFSVLHCFSVPLPAISFALLGRPRFSQGRSQFRAPCPLPPAESNKSFPDVTWFWHGFAVWVPNLGCMHGFARLYKTWDGLGTICFTATFYTAVACAFPPHEKKRILLTFWRLGKLWV